MKKIHTLSLISFFFILSLVIWWFIFFKQSFLFSKKEISMLFFEGSFFFILILILQVCIFILFKNYEKKEKILSYVFSALTHDMKNPLSSIKVQLEYLRYKYDPQILPRIEDDLSNLEKSLHLTLSLADLKNSFKNFEKISLQSLLPVYDHYILDIKEDTVLGNTLFLNLIFKNLFSNALKYSRQKNPKIFFSTQKNNSYIHCKFSNEGFIPIKFKKGLGLQICEELIAYMGGFLSIDHSSQFTVNLYLKY